jgi:hypothetical protein
MVGDLEDGQGSNMSKKPSPTVSARNIKQLIGHSIWQLPCQEIQSLHNRDGRSENTVPLDHAHSCESAGRWAGILKYSPRKFSEENKK